MNLVKGIASEGTAQFCMFMDMRHYAMRSIPGYLDTWIPRDTSLPRYILALHCYSTNAATVPRCCHGRPVGREVAEAGSVPYLIHLLLSARYYIVTLPHAPMW